MSEVLGFGLWVMVFNATFNYIIVILWWLVLLVGETGVPGDSHVRFSSEVKDINHSTTKTPIDIGKEANKYLHVLTLPVYYVLVRIYQ